MAGFARYPVLVHPQDLDSEIAATLRDLMEEDEESPINFTKKSAPRKAVKRAEGRTGRSAFVDPICADHPDWEFEDGTFVVADGEVIHCARFGHLPGGGRGIHQPSAWTIIRVTTADFIKPLLIIALLLGSFFGLKHFVLGGHFLQSERPVRPTACGVSNSGQHATGNAVRDSVANASRRHECSSTNLSPSPRVTPTPVITIEKGKK